MELKDSKGVKCGKGGIVTTIKLDSVKTAEGSLRINLDVFISDSGNFSISGVSYFRGREDSAGQIESALKEWRDNAPFGKTYDAVNFILRAWKAYHLNDVKAGTIEQHAALRDMPKHTYPQSWYDVACEHLKSKGMYEVELDGKPYKFGYSWLTHPIPADDLSKIRGFFAPSFFPPYNPSEKGVL